MRSGSPGAVQPSGGGYGKRNAVGTRGSPGRVPGGSRGSVWCPPGCSSRAGGGAPGAGAGHAAGPRRPLALPGLALGYGFRAGGGPGAGPSPALPSDPTPQTPPPGSPNPSCPRRGSPGPAPGGIQPAGPGVRPGTRAGEPRGLRGLGNWWWAKHREVGTAGSLRREVVKCQKGGWEVSVLLWRRANAEG